MRTRRRPGRPTPPPVVRRSSDPFGGSSSAAASIRRSTPQQPLALFFRRRAIDSLLIPRNGHPQSPPLTSLPLSLDACQAVACFSGADPLLAPSDGRALCNAPVHPGAWANLLSFVFGERTPCSSFITPSTLLWAAFLSSFALSLFDFPFALFD